MKKNWLMGVVYRLATNQTLERKYKDHKLKGEFEGFRECHIKQTYYSSTKNKKIYSYLLV